VRSAISATHRGPWFTADQMQHPCVYHATVMFMQLMLFLDAIQGHFYVTGVLHSLLWSAV
jgi:hypothetical protein